MKYRNKLGYAAGDMGISVSYFAVGFFFIFYLTDIVGMDPWLAGLAFFVGKLWDGVNDPLMGILSDRTRSKYGRKRVYILFGALPFALSFILLWMIPLNSAVWVQFIFAVLSMMIYATAYTAVVVPYMAMVPVMTSNYNERTQITGLRAILSTFGTLIGGGTAMMLSSFTTDIIGLRTITAGFGLFSLITLLIASQSIKGMENTQTEETEIVRFSFSQYVKLVKEKNVYILLFLKFSGAIATGSLSASLPFFAQHVLGNRGVSSIGLAIYVAISAISIPFWSRAAQKYDKRVLLLIGNSASAVVLLMVGIFVNQGDTTFFFIGCFLLGLFMSAYLFIPYSFVPDLVDYYESKTGERHESVFFGLWMTVHQLGISFAGLILGAVLAIFGYTSTSGSEVLSSVTGVRIIFGIIPGLFLFLTALIAMKYGITREVYLDVRSKLSKVSSRR